MAEETTQETIKSSAKVDAAATTSQVIYCGPSLPAKYGLQKHTIFLGGLPDHVAKLVSEIPAIGMLIVPVESLVATTKALRRSGCVESASYKAIKNVFRKGV
ncbi:MAG: hypothetical protein H6Q73_1818 [Firmicutes bacterium]|nr:hypothetical protein [Bacillota bacterium]